MQETYYERFETCWKKFITQLQGQMMIQARKGVFTFASFNLILGDSIGFWDSRHSEGARWLDGYEKEHSEKASRIRNILLKDMKFTDETDNSSKNDMLKYIVPVASAVVGFGVSKTIGASNVIQAVCTVAPAIVTYPVTTNIINTASENKKNELIQAYLKQLDKFKLSIESILKDNN